MTPRHAAVVVVGLLLCAGLAQAPAQAAGRGAAAVAGDPVIAAAGDIACPGSSPRTSTKCRQADTADLLGAGGYAAVLPLGDEQYNCGELAEFQRAYDPTWGAYNAVAHPIVGDNEYAGSGCSTPGASGYYTYFGSRANPQDPSCTRACQGYYSYDLGNWHLVALNSECNQAGVGGCGASGPMATWLKSDLRQHANQCILAYMHRPYWGNGSVTTKFKPFVQILYDAGADLLLNGHVHYYQRFAPQDPSSRSDPNRGLVQVTAGTGGVGHAATIKTPVLPNVAVTNNKTFGVLQLTLHAASYDLSLVPESGATFTDSTSAGCHNASPPEPQPPTATTSSATDVTTTGATLGGTVNPNGAETTYSFEHGLTASYGSTTQPASAGAGTSPVSASASISGLLPGTTYHYRIAATNSAGTSQGSDQTFTTGSSSACTLSSVTAPDTGDTFVYAGSTRNNYGTAAELKANNVGDPANERTMFLGFDTAGIVPAGCTVTGVRLTMYTGQTAAQQQKISVYAQDATTWSESGLTWANQPARGGQVAADLPFSLSTAGQQQDFDLPDGSWLSRTLATSVSITSPTGAAKLFAAKESTASPAPVLTLTLS